MAVRLNIRHLHDRRRCVQADAGVLREKPNIKWTKDRGKDFLPLGSIPSTATASTIIILAWPRRKPRGRLLSEGDRPLAERCPWCGGLQPGGAGQTCLHPLARSDRQWEACSATSGRPAGNGGAGQTPQIGGPALRFGCAVPSREPWTADFPVGSVPILYLPGVARTDLRAVNECPDASNRSPNCNIRHDLSQVSAKDWTVLAFLKSAQGGLGLEVADGYTRAAMITALNEVLERFVQARMQKARPGFLQRPVDQRGLTRDVLTWIDQGDAYAERIGPAAWGAFSDICVSQLGLDPRPLAFLQVLKCLRVARVSGALSGSGSAKHRSDTQTSPIRFENAKCLDYLLSDISTKGLAAMERCGRRGATSEAAGARDGNGCTRPNNRYGTRQHMRTDGLWSGQKWAKRRLPIKYLGDLADRLRNNPWLGGRWMTFKAPTQKMAGR